MTPSALDAPRLLDPIPSGTIIDRSAASLADPAEQTGARPSSLTLSRLQAGAPGASVAALEQGLERLHLVLRARALWRAHPHYTPGVIPPVEVCARALAAEHSVRSPISVYKWCGGLPRWAHVAQLADAELSAAVFATRATPGRAAEISINASERDKTRAKLLISNRNANGGSTPGAIRRALRDGTLRPEVADALRAREAAGLPLVTQALRDELYVPEVAARALRSPRDAWLETCYSAGSLFYVLDDVTGQRREAEPGELETADDATCNLYCCVPHGLTCPRNMPGAKCVENFGVMLGRFQFLLTVDHRSFFIRGMSYTARPKSSYRAEDLTSLFQLSWASLGKPKKFILEHGISASDLITRTMRLAGVEIVRADSPHQKVVEMVFGNLWERLSYLPGQVGRSRGEEKLVEPIAESCRQGATDPRLHFPMLHQVVAGLLEAIGDWNSHMVESKRHGHWRPAELWARHAPKHLRPIPATDLWHFSPHVAKGTNDEGLVIKGAQIETNVPLAPGYSLPFTFQASWLLDLATRGQDRQRARVYLHFNPFADDCRAVAVLANDFHRLKAGTVLGTLQLCDEHARAVRRTWGYSTQLDDGGEGAARASHRLARVVAEILPDGKPGVAQLEYRDGVNPARVLDFNHAASAEPPPPVGRASARAVAENAEEDWAITALNTLED